VARLSSAAIDCTTFGLIPGEWCFVGGQAGGNRFGDVVPGYARVASADADGINFDKTTFTVGAGDDGTGTTLQLFFGTVIRNEDDPDLIVKYEQLVERTLGRDDDGRQSEYLNKYVYNEMTWNSPLADKVNIDIGGIASSHQTRTGAEGPLSSEVDASIVAALGEDAFNTSSNVYRIRMAIVDPATLNPTPLFSRVTDFSVSIGNNVSVNKAQGTLGGFDTTAGTLDVAFEGTMYFSKVGGITSIRENEDVTFDAIYSKQNAAIILDLPLLANGGGRLQVEMDQPIMVPLESSAAESPFGHTILLNFLPYVPSVGMATG
jgi:hypothetical protein